MSTARKLLLWRLEVEVCGISRSLCRYSYRWGWVGSHALDWLGELQEFYSLGGMIVHRPKLDSHGNRLLVGIALGIDHSSELRPLDRFLIGRRKHQN